VFEFTRNTGGELNINTEMDFSSAQLKAVEILSNPIRHRNANQDYVDNFNDEFLGTSVNSADCKILNPEVITYEFIEESKTLNAVFSEPLIVQNNALGYLLFCELINFQSTNDNHYVNYTGWVRFEKLTASSARERKKWQISRQKAYFGSMRHFFKVAVRKKQKQQGYKVYSISNLGEISSKNLQELRIDSLLIKMEDQNIWKLNTKNLVYIVYTKELESDGYMIDMEKDILRNMTFSTNKLMFLNRKPDVQKSLIEIKDDESVIYVDQNGNLTNPSALLVSGYWSWERIAELVPINFDPKEK
jgi:hypothetical protein